MHKKLLLVFVFLLILFPLVSAVPPFQAGGAKFSEGLVIQYSNYDHTKLNTAFNLSFHVFNISNGVDMSEYSSCHFELYAADGNDVEMPYPIKVNDEFNVFIDAGNFTTLGKGAYIIYCNTSILGGYVSGQFHITPDGLDFTQERALFYLVILLTLLTLTFICSYGFVKSEFPPLKALNFFGAYIFMQLISYFLWTTTAAYITISSYLPLFFKWIFYLMTFFLLPLVLATVFYYFYLAYKAAKLDGMLKHGVPEDRRNRNG